MHVLASASVTNTCNHLTDATLPPRTTRLLAAVFSVLLYLEPTSRARMHTTPMAMAAASTSDCFTRAGMPDAAAIPTSMFLAWYQEAEAAAPARPKLPPLLQLRHSMALSACNVVDVADVFQHGEDAAGGCITAGAFVMCMQQFWSNAGEDTADSLDTGAANGSGAVASALFTVLDVDGVGTVCRRALVPALIMLCGGTRAEKLQLVYRTLLCVWQGCCLGAPVWRGPVGVRCAVRVGV